MQTISKTRDVFTLVTNRVIEELEKGTIPWQRPWTKAGLPRNLVSGKSYNGINVWLLNALDYEQNVFLTYTQVKDLGGFVRKGEKSHMVIFWKWVDEDTPSEASIGPIKRKAPILRYYYVFNIDQCCNIPERFEPILLPRKNNSIELCEQVVKQMSHSPEIRHQGDKAYYQPFYDCITMPHMGRFITREEYYATLFHELIHSTGHESRLKRKEVQTKVSEDIECYSIEELTAEIGACYLSSYTGIDAWNFTKHVAYIEGWLKHLRNDSRCIVYACAQAQKAADYILNKQYFEEGVNDLNLN